MTPDQVRSALHARRVRGHTNTKPCVQDYLAQHKRVVPISGPGHCVQEIDAKYAGGWLLVFFTEDLPEHPGVSTVTTIALNYPTDSSAVEGVVRKAGAPSLTDGETPWTVAMWCFDLPCTDMNATLHEPNRGRTLLVDRAAGLTLDLGAGRARDAAATRILRAHGVTLEP